MPVTNLFFSDINSQLNNLINAQIKTTLSEFHQTVAPSLENIMINLLLHSTLDMKIILTNIYIAIARKQYLTYFFSAMMWILFSTLTEPAHALSSQWIKPDNSNKPVITRIIIAGEPSRADTIQAGIEVQLGDGWKIPWRSSVAPNLYTTFNWHRSTNLTLLSVLWPMPVSINDSAKNNANAAGYIKKLVIPVEITATKKNKHVLMALNLDLVACKQNCQTLHFKLQVSFDPQKLSFDPDASERILQARKESLLPVEQTNFSMTDVKWDRSSQQIYFKFNSPRGWDSPKMFLDSIKKFPFGLPSFNIEGKNLTAIVPLLSSHDFEKLSGQRIIAIIADSYQQAEIKLRMPKSSVILTEIPVSSLVLMIIIALVGGFLLNFMPCMIPVVGLKLLFFLSAKCSRGLGIRPYFLSISFGIIVYFWILAFILAWLKYNGHATGWGVQFQNVWFIFAISTVCIAITFRLLFHQSVSSSYRTQTQLTHHGVKLRPVIKYFLLGFSGALLSTPCVAPFISSSLDEVFSADLSTLFLLFTTIALGMALPYLLIAINPKIIQKIPTPRGIYRNLRIITGIVMLITSIWLITLLKAHINMLWVTTILIIQLTIFLAALTIKSKTYKSILTLGISKLLIVLGYLLTCALFLGLFASTRLNWQELDTTKIDQYIDNNQLIMVMISADWCITCQLNEMILTVDNDLQRELNTKNVVLIKGDWTVEDALISRFLRYNGQSGVPFGIIYGPNAPDGITLPIVLTHASVKQAMKKAVGNDPAF